MRTVMQLTAKARLYRVECWDPPVEGDPKFKYRQHGCHEHVGVVAHSVVEAIELVREKHPTYRIDAVNQCGPVNYIEGSAVNGNE